MIYWFCLITCVKLEGYLHRFYQFARQVSESACDYNKIIYGVLILQVTGLPPGLKGACLHTNMTKGQKEKVIASINGGKVSVNTYIRMTLL